MFRKSFAFVGLLSGFGNAVHAQATNPVSEALRQFEAYKPTIEATENAFVEGPEARSGDLNGDGLTDCLVLYNLLPQSGSDTLLDMRTTVYLNTGTGMKVDGTFPKMNVFCIPEKIKNGVISVQCYTRTLPYQEEKGKRYYRWKARKLVRVR